MAGRRRRERDRRRREMIAQEMWENAKNEFLYEMTGKNPLPRMSPPRRSPPVVPTTE